MTQSTLFPDDRYEPPAQPHSPTSKAAAEAIEPAVGTLQARVLAYIRQCGLCGATDDELQRFLEMDPSTERPRRIELQRKGLIRDSGKTRPTRSGRQAIVWEVV